MVVTLIISALLIVTGARVADGNCSPCEPPPNHYDEFNCTGVILKQGQCCPVKYLCPPHLSDPNPAKCYFNGHIYGNGEYVSDTEAPTCINSCKCSSSGSSKSSFKCVVTPEQGPTQEDVGCLRQYRLDKCQHVRRVCGKENIEKLHRCSWRGKEFYEGERFTPDSDSCYQCICDRQFDNTTFISDNLSNCRKIECGLELQYTEQFRRGCAPVYSSHTACCPTGEWICPATLPSDTPREDMTCPFDTNIIQHWDSLITGDKCLECRCNKPPVLSCIRKPNCVS